MSARTKFPCTRCGKEKDLIDDFYSSTSPIYAYHERISVCKDCLINITDINNLNSVMDVLRMIDKPFIPSLWERSIEESERTNRNLFGTYMKNVVMKQYRDLNWSDSTLDEEILEMVNSEQTNLSEEVLDRWRGWEIEQIKELERNYQELISTYEHDTPIQRNIYKNIAVAQLQADEAIAKGRTNDYKNLMKVISDLMNDAKIKPLQDTGENDGGLSTWGQWVAKIEEEEPIPEPSEEFKDVDNIRKYVDKWFVGHMKRILGITSKIDSDAESGQ